MSTRFQVPFVRGKARVRFSAGTGHAYTPKATIRAMEAIRAAYRAAGGAKAPEGVPVTVHIMTVRPLQRTAPKGVESAPDVQTPDADNIAKLVLDALNGEAWADDRQVTSLLVGKCDRMRGVTPMTDVWVEWEGR